MQKLYTPQEVAEALKLRVNAVYEYIRMGKLVAAKFGNRYRIAQEDLERFIEESRTVRADRPTRKQQKMPKKKAVSLRKKVFERDGWRCISVAGGSSAKTAPEPGSMLTM